MEPHPSIGIIGGSGLYDLPGLENKQEIALTTPFGDPSDVLQRGELAGRTLYFLPRHGKGHRLAPHEINHRANIYALRSVGVRWLIAVTAVGSLRDEVRPRDVLVPDQLFDRTSRREHHTFFGQGIVGHVSLAEPYSATLRALLVESARAVGAQVHDGGTYVNMDGPGFSTRAESEFYRSLGASVIGMTNLPEAKLAREAEIACATLSLVTDYDCWKKEEEPVTAAMVVAHLQANIAMARNIVNEVLPKIPTEPNWPEHRALDGAIQTDPAIWPAATKEKLFPLLQRFLS